jgi:hypothetical protein
MGDLHMRRMNTYFIGKAQAQQPMLTQMRIWAVGKSNKVEKQDGTSSTSTGNPAQPQAVSNSVTNCELALGSKGLIEVLEDASQTSGIA